MITRLLGSSKTQRAWNGRDDIHQHYTGCVPLNEKFVSLSLTWKKEKESKPSSVGCFVLNMPALAKGGFIREVEGYYILRFQRAGRVIEISQNRSTRARLLGLLPKGY
jgi:hypothetical protein